MREHGPNSRTCCTDLLVAQMRAITRNSDQYKQQGLTLEFIRDIAKAAGPIASLDGHVITDEVRDRAVALTEMAFTVVTPETARLYGDEVEHYPWLAAKRADLFTEGGFWDNYRQLLESRIPESAQNRLDELTDEILDALEDPTRLGQWDRRGLVMGHVQSGKTNNYVGLIAKAMDAGYQLVVVLAGLHNNLRSQTQFRVDEGITGRDTRDPGDLRPIGVGRFERAKAAVSLTSAGDAGDFKTSSLSVVAFDFGQLDSPTVFVVKKNGTILDNLYQWLDQNAPRRAGHERIAGIPLLVIDDEADSASIDTSKRDDDSDPTRINREIRRLLSLFEQSAYVGYTATPFANVLISDRTRDEALGDDLFPRSFIFSMPAPDTYVGPNYVFGIGIDEDLPDPPFVRDVLDASAWIPPVHKSSLVVHHELFPASLKRAIRAFVLSSAARRVRGDGEAHHSMLVHVTRFQNTQVQVRDQVKDELFDLRNTLLYGGTGSAEVIEMRRIWEQDFEPLSRILRNRGVTREVPLSFDEVGAELVSAVAKIQVRTINGSSADVLDYHKNPDGLSTIVIGGEKLSRGLTLEGLSISYYLRASRMYDTLMQMGRWFGYRPRYLDLCQIYTTPEISGLYRSIAEATDELLDDFGEMNQSNATPTEFGLKVRTSPGMMVTSRAKMRDGSRVLIGFGSTRPEVTTFRTDLEWRKQCLLAMRDFMESLGDPAGRFGVNRWRPGTNPAWLDVPGETILDFFDGLAAADLYADSRSQPRYIADYIRKRLTDGGLSSWTVLLRSVGGEARSERIAGLEVGLARRSPHGSNTLGTYSIKSLIGSADERFDLSDEELEESGLGSKSYGRAIRRIRHPGKGLLILYFVDGEVPGLYVERGAPFSAFCVSFPEDPSGTKVEYVVNNVFEAQEKEAR